jgi:hypothetical protein
MEKMKDLNIYTFIWILGLSNKKKEHLIILLNRLNNRFTIFCKKVGNTRVINARSASIQLFA